MTHRTLYHRTLAQKIDWELRRKRIHGVPERRDLRRRRARRMAAQVPAPIARPAPTAEQIQRAMASDWTFGAFFDSLRSYLASRRPGAHHVA